MTEFSHHSVQPPQRRRLGGRLRISRRSALGLAGASAVFIAGNAKADPATGNFGQVLGRRQTGDSVYKSRAISDYSQSMSEFGGSLAAPAHQLLQQFHRGVPWQFDVLIIGSGYGASITAARIAPSLRAGMRLGVLERGREWVPGTFPDRLPDVTDEARLQLLGKKKGQVNNPVGLFNVQQFDEITILSGSGLGGSSLINASVAIRTDADVFAQQVWPQALRDRAFLDPYYELAEYELGVAREPWDHTHKMRAQRRVGTYLAPTGACYEPANLMITRSPNCDLPVLNRQRILQRGCIDCGDCLTGCNVGAKNMLSYNYLPLARRAGAEFYTQTEVHRVEKCADHYRVYFTYHSQNQDGTFEALHGTTTARVVVLGAGSLGSSEILMRSQAPNMKFSAHLGSRWTGNGDALGFIRKSQVPTGIGGFSAYPTDRDRVGPTIQTNLNYPSRSLAGRVLIQDGAAARAYANVLGALMLNPDLSQTQILLGMGHDGAEGRISLDERGFARVNWPTLLDSPYRKLIRGEFQRVAEALGGEYRYLKIFGDRMISVHPLGGCGMADDPACGVVNDRGQVFDGHGGGDVDPQTGSARVHQGLYVVDGAILPTSIGCNPSLTISALAERCAHWMLSDPTLNDLFHERS
jgi:cholesterol oxidase